MGDLNSSDCSWKKMVIAKANHEWISKIKCETPENLVVVENDSSSSDDDVANTTNFSTADESSMCFSNDKEENEDYDADQAGGVVETFTQCLDPLMIAEPRQRRRRGSVAKGPKNETPEERAARLAKMSAYAAQRLANESPEQRAVRLKRMSEYAARRLARETSEQREQRLARMSAYAAKRLSQETPEQRRSRLNRMSAYAARRQAMKKIMNTKDPQNVDVQGEMSNQS